MSHAQCDNFENKDRWEINKSKRIQSIDRHLAGLGRDHVGLADRDAWVACKLLVVVPRDP